MLELLRWLGIVTGYPVQWLFFKRKTYYEDREDFKKYKKQGAVVITNHINIFDYVLNAFFLLPRKLYVVASELAYTRKFNSMGMKFFGGIKADRNKKSLSFIDESVGLLRRGKLVQIFPEGRNTDDGGLQKFHPTYIIMALRADAVIIPIVTDGNYGIFKSAHIMVGKTIRLSDYGLDAHSKKEQIAEANIQIRERVLLLQEKLKAELDRGKNKP